MNRWRSVGEVVTGLFSQLNGCGMLGDREAAVQGRTALPAGAGGGGVEG